MLKKYRRDFVLLNTLTVGIVLMITLSFLGAVVYINEYDDMESVMSMSVRPWNYPGGDQRQEAVEKTDPDIGHPPEEKSWNDPKDSAQSSSESSVSQSSESKENKALKKRRINNNTRYINEDISVYVLSSDRKSFALLSESTIYEGDDELELMRDISVQSERFGSIDKYGIIFYKERSEAGTYKIAITGKWYMTIALLRILLILISAFLISMGLVFLISMHLSRLAARPMENAIGMERQFVRDISHDLKTPVTVILANNSILRSNPDTKLGDNMQWIDSTDSAARDMMNMVSEMLTLSKLENTEVRAEKECVNLSMEAERTVLQLESVAYENRIELASDIEENVQVNAVPEYVKRICSSLIENAVKYEPSGGRVGVSLKIRRKKAVLAVHNKLSFIPKEELEHIFESFYRGDKTRSSKNGHGLGLTIIKRMAELSGADISVESSESEGTVFKVTFELI